MGVENLHSSMKHPARSQLWGRVFFIPHLLKHVKPIAFYPELARELGSVVAAIYYQQLYYWSDKGSREDGFIWKSAREIEEETTITEMQQRLARKILVKSGWLQEKKLMANGHPTMHYKCLKQYQLSIRSNNESHSLKQRIHLMPATNGLVENNESITENTTESTTDITERAQAFIAAWNKVHGTKYEAWKPIVSNLTYWLEQYPAESILRAMVNVGKDKFWRDKMNPVMFLRRRNPQHEEVDYIGQMLHPRGEEKPKTSRIIS